VKVEVRVSNQKLLIVRCRRSEGKPGQMSLVKLILEIPINEE
jgi:hypothetical protein